MRNATARGHNAGLFPLQLPVAGWNTRDQLSEMEPIYAQLLDNWYAEDGRLVLRKGLAEHADGMTGPVRTVMTYDDGGTKKLFASVNSGIYDVTSSGSVGTAEVSSIGSTGRWSWTQFAAGGGQYLWCCNGATAARHYDGTSWDTPTINNVTSSDIIGVAAHKARLWLIENGTLDLWYLPVSSVAGDATKYPLGALCRLGGSVAGIGTWTRDGGDGMDDLFVIVTTNGEVLAFQGTDPADGATWAIVGRYNIPAPVGGVRCMTGAGAALMILTRAGLISMSDIMAGYPVQRSVAHVIEPSFSEQTGLFPDSTAWETFYHRGKNRIICNAPSSGSPSVHQYVLSASSGTWSRILGYDALSWVEFGGELYYGGRAGKVFKADTGYDDLGGKITGDVIFSPNKLGSPGLKFWKRARLHFLSSGSVSPTVQMIADYARPSTTLAATGATTAPDGDAWNSGTWNSAVWGGVEETRPYVLGLQGKGYVGALRCSVSAQGAELKLTAAEINAEFGRTL